MLHSSHLPHTRRLWVRFLILVIVALVLAIVFFPRSTSPGGLVCGDLDRNGKVTAADLIYTINYIFRGGMLPDPYELADVNGDGTVDLTDVIYLINYIYKAGPSLLCPAYGLPVTVSGCKLFSTAEDSLGPPPNLDCIEWWYDGEGSLRIRHLNAGFNCCPTEIIVNAYVDTGAIFIEEREYLDYGGCSCLCLFDLEYTIENVHPDHYAVRVLEPYVKEADTALAALITINPTPDSGNFCVERTHYPWSP